MVAVDLAQRSMDSFVYDRLFNEYSLAYETFNAVLYLPDNTEVYGIGYTDFGSYFESTDGGKNYFPAGFIVGCGDVTVSDEQIEKGIEITNLDYANDDYGFVYSYSTDEFQEHCVVDGQYVKYGIDENGVISYSTEEYEKGVCDESLGALYSYDENRMLYDPDMGEYVPITGESLYEIIDYDALEAEVNRILDEQDFNFSKVDIETHAKFAQEAVSSYLLSLQEETFMGCDVDVLIEEVSKLDPMQCIRITPEGNVIVDIEKDIPQEPTALAKWTVGICCGIAVAGSIALTVFVPAAAPASGAISGAAIDVFMQVVVENHAIEDVNWGKVAVSATAGALMAWVCPMGASAIAKSVAENTGKEVLSKIAGYGVQTLSNAVVSGATNASYSIIDGKSKEDVWDSFLIGAALGACCTAAASVLSEVGHAAMNALSNTHPENWFVKLSNTTSTFIADHQVHLFSEPVESILTPKSVYEASKLGITEYNKQAVLTAGKKGGSYSEVCKNSNGEYTQVHETPSFNSTNADKRADGPSVKMLKEDHVKTASWGNSKEAQEYRAVQRELMEAGKTHEAIQMDIDNIHDLFGDKYDDAIAEMLEYATQIGWW